MMAIDWICLAVLAASLLLGAWRGLLYEALSLAAWVAAWFVARWAGPLLGQWLPMGDTAGLRDAAGMVLVFIVVVFAGGLIASLARRAVRTLGVRPVDRLFGAVFGVLRGVVLLLVLALAAHATGWDKQPGWQQSSSGPWLETGLRELAVFLPPGLRPYLLDDQPGDFYSDFEKRAS